MKKTTIYTLVLFFFSFIGFSQTNQFKTSDKKRVFESETTLQAQQTSRPAIESNYYGYDHKISAISVTNAIPVNFPTKTGFTTKTEYLTVINKWIKENPALIKPEMKNTTIND